MQPRSTRHSAILAALAGALVLAAVLALKLGAEPALPAEIALGVSLPVLYFALIGTIRPAVAYAASYEDGSPCSTGLGASEYAALTLSHDPSFSVDDLKRLLAGAARSAPRCGSSGRSSRQ